MRNVSCAFQLFYCSQVKNSPLLCAQIKTGGWKSSECLCWWFEQRWNVPADTQPTVWERCYSRNLGPDTVSGSVRLGATRIIGENFKPGSPWQQRIPRSRRPLTDISAASPGRPRCMARLSAGGFWQTRTGSEVRDQMITGIHQHSYSGECKVAATSPWGSPAGAAPLGGTKDEVLRCPTCPTSESGESWTKRCRWANPESLAHRERERESQNLSSNGFQSDSGQEHSWVSDINHLCMYLNGMHKCFQSSLEFHSFT